MFLSYHVILSYLCRYPRKEAVLHRASLVSLDLARLEGHDCQFLSGPRIEVESCLSPNGSQLYPGYKHHPSTKQLIGKYLRAVYENRLAREQTAALFIHLLNRKGKLTAPSIKERGRMEQNSLTV